MSHPFGRATNTIFSLAGISPKEKAEGNDPSGFFEMRTYPRLIPVVFRLVWTFGGDSEVFRLSLGELRKNDTDFIQV